MAKINERRQFFMRLIEEELDRAYEKHGTEAWARHQFYAILLEEVDELWDNIKNDRPLDVVLDEMVQVAAMCVRYAETGQMGARLDKLLP